MVEIPLIKKLEWRSSDLLPAVLRNKHHTGRTSLLFVLKDSYLVKGCVLNLQFMSGEL